VHKESILVKGYHETIGEGNSMQAQATKAHLLLFVIVWDIFQIKRHDNITAAIDIKRPINKCGPKKYTSGAITKG